MRKSVLVPVLVALAPLVLASIPTEAAPVFVTSRADLGGNDFVDWADLGPSMTVAPNPFTISSRSGLDVKVSMDSFSDFQRRQQGLDINGDFAPGDALLFTRSGGGTVSFE